MNKALTAVLMLCIISSSMAKFDPDLCFSNAVTITHQFKLFLVSTKTQPLEVSNILANAYDTFELVDPLINSCGLDLPLLDIIDQYKPANTTSCFANIEKIVNIAIDVANTEANLLVDKMIINLPRIIEAFKIYKETNADCKLIEKNSSDATLLSSSDLGINIFSCIHDSEALFSDAKQFLNDYKSHNYNIPQLFNEAVQIYKDLYALNQECGIEKLDLPEIKNIDQIATCVKDISETATAIENTISLLKERQFNELLNATKNVYHAITTDIAECPKKINTLKTALSLNIQCVKNLAIVGKDSYELYQKLTNQDLSPLEKLQSIQSLLKDFQPFFDECGIKVQVPDIPTNAKVVATVECVSDVAKAVNALKNIYVDAVEFNIINAAKDVMDIFNAATSAVQVCTQIEKKDN
ncbi:hypothetical protein TTHERM_00420590 (macronuclear) [Tetrahymena thermophila SB210]|uniref:Transmembrane protein n=1 Tax=Tetrahymena thermophila (strain SB210) TaxID=312017 RepID=I7LTQ2_TETTS|nr:hypothetical protein TTHERM_00420590 [Tetrahymena thermophila SB210]EAR85651.1 hypothetical protein TTHERM_00420590 [Tetrahymena thermophila SB210]|eukprot:XP_001033314.1 hypothetical protein TTHERM_00420590 [Tetrahymena thermophila SB210]